MTEAEKERLYQLSLKTGYGYRKPRDPLPTSMLAGGALVWDQEAEEYWEVFGLPIDANEIQHDIEEAANVTNMNFRADNLTKVTTPFDLPGLTTGCGCSGPVYYE